jgi:4-alpha-glucanotransferase
MSDKLPKFIRFGREICGNLGQAEQREWWLADGLGGYASGTVAQSLTRRYHGLLVSADSTTLARRLLFAKAEATLIDADCRYLLSTNRWASGAVEPAGLQYIESFRLEGSVPVWRYEIADIVLEQRLWFVPGHRTLLVTWNLVRPVERSLELDIALLCNDRDHHGETRPDNPPDLAAEVRDGGLRLSSGGMPCLYFRSDGGRFEASKVWWRDFHLPLERERGLPDREDHFCAGHLLLPLDRREPAGFMASRNEISESPDFEQALRRRHFYDGNRIQHAGLCAHGYADAPDWIRQLLLDSDRFLIHRAHPGVEPEDTASPQGKAGHVTGLFQYWNDRLELSDGAAIVAGYPWFAEWGRDTFIALPGLALATGRFVVARRILEDYGDFIEDGLLPNTLPEDGSPAGYNTVDAALWYIEAWRDYFQHTQDLGALRRAFPRLKAIVAAHVRGARFGIGMDPRDGLIHAGEPGSQLTWMDARVEGVPVTPRMGKPVEINALWLNALRTLQAFAVTFGEDSGEYTNLAEHAQTGFQRFLKPVGGLFDVLDGPQGHDPSIRPNQILAVSLTHSPLNPEAQKRVVDEVAHHLLTSYGLRTLAPHEPGYCQHYAGGINQRDAAYHQGPVWAWLLGHYALAEHRVTGDAVQAQARLEPLRDHLFDAGLGSISELFDGAPPHAPRGAPCQAWSVACTLYAWRTLECAKIKHKNGSKS